MSLEEAEYFERRAEAEVILAQQATDGRVVRAHYELAAAYLDRVHGDSPKSSGGLFGS